MPAQPDIKVMVIGKERRPIAIVDDFFPDPDELRESAKKSSFDPALNLYPGVRAALPEKYWSREVSEIVETVAEKAFALRGEIAVIDSSYSIVTTPAENLEIGQRLPHVDAYRRNQIALIHYLSPDIADGTAFFRHRTTGLEYLNEDLRHFYTRQIDRELERRGDPPARYLHGDTALFERIEEVPAKYNRALFYFGSQLHSGAITPDTPLSPDPARGRLTVTGFMTIG